MVGKMKLFIAILSILVMNAIAMDDITVGDLPAGIREQFIDIVVKGVLNIGNNCTAQPVSGQVKLLLYNRTNPDNPITLDPSDPYQIDPTKPLIVVVHGWTASSTAYGIPEIKDAYLKRYDCNVVVVDWSKLAWQLYTTSYCDLPGIGELLANFLCNYSKQTGVPLSEVHMVGHSLGAHLSGFTGAFTQQICAQKIGRITGLDPAGPLFQDMPAEDRLDPTDAIRVDAVQTNEGFLGYYKGECGQVNFHVNCGTLQLGEIDPTQILDIYNMSMTVVAGNHLRSLDLMAESINSDEFKAKSCNCPILPLICSTDTLNPSFIIMGEDSPPNPPKVNYYIPTAASSPYALGCTPYPLQGCK